MPSYTNGLTLINISTSYIPIILFFDAINVVDNDDVSEYINVSSKPKESQILR